MRIVSGSRFSQQDDLVCVASIIPAGAGLEKTGISGIILNYEYCDTTRWTEEYVEFPCPMVRQQAMAALDRNMALFEDLRH